MPIQGWLELMDERGSGIRRMIRVLEQHGNPTPFFKADHDCLVVDFAVPDRDTAFNPSGLDSPQKEEGRKELPPRDAILRELTKAEHITTAQCVQRLGIPNDCLPNPQRSPQGGDSEAIGHWTWHQVCFSQISNCEAQVT